MLGKGFYFFTVTVEPTLNSHNRETQEVNDISSFHCLVNIFALAFRRSYYTDGIILYKYIITIIIIIIIIVIVIVIVIVIIIVIITIIIIIIIIIIMINKIFGRLKRRENSDKSRILEDFVASLTKSCVRFCILILRIKG